jgi:hypothetical protein
MPPFSKQKDSLDSLNIELKEGRTVKNTPQKNVYHLKVRLQIAPKFVLNFPKTAM